MYKFLLPLIFLTQNWNSLYSQVAIGTKTADPSSMLEVKSDKKGMLVPRMTSSERKAISSPAIGLLVYQTDGTNGFYYYSGSEWKFIVPASTASGGIATEATTTSVSSVSGTTNRISSSGGSNPVIDIASTYAGQASITTLGTIATGNWNATVIPATKGGAGTINGLLKANGSGTVSAAVKGTDYAPALKLTTTGTSGASSYNATTGTLNIPVYAGGSGVSYTFNAPLSLSGSSVSLPLATAAVNGYLSSTDWNLFNNKINSNLSITAGTKTKISYDSKGLVLSGSDATTTDIAEGSNQYFTEQRVLNSKLTGLTSGTTAELTAADNIQGALQNLQAQIKTKSSVVDGSNKGDMLYWDGTAWIKIPVGEEAQSLILCKGVPTWGGCLAELSTDSISAITYQSALFSGSISNNGGTIIYEKGFVWDTIPNPTVQVSTKIKIETSLNSFETSLTSLSANKKYYVRAYAINSKGISYGNEIHFTTSTIAVTQGLVAYFPLNGNSNDLSENGNHLIKFGNPEYVDFTVNGISRLAANFPNGNDYYKAPDQFNSLVNNFPTGTVSFWIKLNSHYISGHYFGIDNNFFVKQKHGVGEDMFFGIMAGSTKIRMQVSGIFPSSGNMDVIGNSNLELSRWYHVTGVWDGQMHKLYLNGTLDGIVQNSTGISNRSVVDYTSLGSILYTGTAENPSGAYGAIADFRIYNRALTESEITYLATH